MDYMWLEEQGLITQPEETKEDKLKYLEDYLNSVATRNRLLHIDTIKERGIAV